MRSRARRAWQPAQRRAGPALWVVCHACGKAWGRAKEKLCASRNIMHRNLPLTQQKWLSRKAFCSIIRRWFARAPARPVGNRRPIWRWVDGERSRRIGAQLAFGRVLRAMRPALHGDDSIEAGAPRLRPDLTATPASLRDSRHGAGSGDASLGTGLAIGDRRDAGGARRTVPVTGPAPEKGGVPPGRRRRWERAHPLVEPGSRQRLL